MPYPSAARPIIVGAIAFLVLMAPVSFAFDRTYRSVVEEYARLRRAAGAADEDWPSGPRRLDIFLSPLLVLLAAVLASTVTAYGVIDEALRTDPFGRLPGFVPDPRSPALVPTVLLGAGFAVALVVLAIHGFRSPWWPVQSRLRRAVATKGRLREELLGEALRYDPEVHLDPPPAP